MKPMLEENDGWAVFITTPRGRNHAFEMSKHAARTKGWFYQLLTARDTGALSAETLDEVLAEYRALYGFDQGSGLFDQEYLCDWHSQLLGSFYSYEMAQVRSEGRILDCEPIASEYVHRSWDIGIGDDTSVWWFQVQPSGQLLILDHLAASGVSVEWWRDEIFKRERERGWLHGNDYVPHDAKVKEWGTGQTRVETMSGAGPEADPGADGERSTTASTRCAARCRCACFIRAARMAAFRRWSSTAASGTTRRNVSSRPPCMTGRRIRPTVFAISRRPGAARRGARSRRKRRRAGYFRRRPIPCGEASGYDAGAGVPDAYLLCGAAR